jgi:outer membrane protein
MNRRLTATCFFVVLVAAAVVSAQNADWRIGGRVLYMTGGATSPEVGDTGAGLELGAGGGLEFDAVARFSEMFAAEFTIGVTVQPLTVIGDDLCCGGIDGGWVWLVPLTALGQFHIPVYGKWDPYVGLGVAWTFPVDSLSSDIKAVGVQKIDFQGTVGFAMQGGVNYTINNRWYANLDIRYLGVSLEARVTTDAGKLQPVDLEIEPWVLGIGFRYRF